MLALKRDTVLEYLTIVGAEPEVVAEISSRMDEAVNTDGLFPVDQLEHIMGDSVVARALEESLRNKEGKYAVMN